MMQAGAVAFGYNARVREAWTFPYIRSVDWACWLYAHGGVIFDSSRRMKTIGCEAEP